MAYAVDITNIRFGQPETNIYRIVIETSSKTNFKSFFLDKPHRFVVDIPSSSFKASKFKMLKSTPIKDYRAGKQADDSTHIVFDLKSNLKIVSSFTIAASKKNQSNRIVIDLKIDNNSPPILYTLPIVHKKSKEDKITQLVATYLSRHEKQEVKPVNITNLIETHGLNDIKEQSFSIPFPQRKPIENIYIIAIDAGHGGKDPGANNKHIYEKNITLSLSNILKKQLQQTGRYKIILTRPRDKFVKLRKRVDIARLAGADLFISLHADKIDNKKVRGTAIYTLSEKASDKESAKLAKRENEADIIAGVNLSHEDEDVADILIDLAIRDTMNNSSILANIILVSFKAHNLKLLKTAHRSAGFAVLKAPDIPSVLIEAGFISNAHEAKLLSSKTHQKKIAKAITNSINRYFAKQENAALH